MHREDRELVKGHTARKWQHLDLNIVDYSERVIVCEYA